MPAIDFYYIPESPPCRAVEMVASIAGVKLNKHYVNLFTEENLKEDFVKLNPTHKLPFIVDGDLKMGESRAIMCYLVNKYMPNDKTLYPKDPEKRAKIDELLHFDVGSLYVTGLRLLRPRLFGPHKELDPEAEKAFKDNLEILENHLAKSTGKFYLGDNITLGDITLATSLTFLNALGYDVSGYKRLSAYLERLKKSIPNYGEINDGPLKSMTDYVRTKQEG